MSEYSSLSRVSTQGGSSNLSRISTQGDSSKFRGARRSKSPFSFLGKREKIKIMMAGDIDRTPRPLFSEDYIPVGGGIISNLITAGDTGNVWSNAKVVDLGSRASTTDARYSGSAINSQFFASGTLTGSITRSFMTTQMDTAIREDTKADASDTTIMSSVASGYFMPEEPYVKPKILSSVLIVIKETPTFFLFDRPNQTAEQDSEEGVRVEEDNQYYEYVTVGQGRLKKTTSTESQTMDLMKKTRMAMAWRVKKRSKTTFVSDWVMYDAEKEIEEENELEESGSAVRIGVDEHAITVVDKKTSDNKMQTVGADTKMQTAGADAALLPEDQFQKIAETEDFLDACARMERLLSSNVYREQQKIFRGLMQKDPFRLEVDFKYTMELLWSFTSDYVRGRTVTGMCWNSLNTDLLAVGYGKYSYEERLNGLVCCWTIKNPTQPERKYSFDSPVTAVNFSKSCPNLLACGFYNGSVIILDISSRSKSIIAESNRESSPSYEPLWQIFWFRGEDYHQNEEQLMTCCQDGRICRYRREKTLNCFPMMRVSRMEGQVKGIDQLRRCKAHDIPVSRHPAALVLTRHPEDSLIYYVGTDEGCIHKCSMNYLHHHIDIILAHKGPIHSMQFSPFCSKIFLTCGADWFVRIWCEGVGEPLLTLKTTMETVLGAAWSPTHSTILASISGKDIHFWDIRRKVLVPASSKTSPTDSINVMVEFTASGLNLVVGDGDGSVHVYGLDDMPFPPFFQEAALVHAIKKALTTRPYLLKALKKIGKPFF